MQEKISIIVPVYNVEKLSWTMCWVDFKADLYQFWIALINDGSKDQSGDLCDQLVSKKWKYQGFFILRTLEFPMPEM